MKRDRSSSFLTPIWRRFFGAGPSRPPRALRADVSPEAPAPAWRNPARAALILLVAAGAVYLGTREIRILVVGAETLDPAARLATILLLDWRPLPRRLRVLEVPADTLVNLPKRGALALGSVYPYGLAAQDRAYALAMTRSAIEALLGLRIHYFLRLDHAPWANWIDALGGLPDPEAGSAGDEPPARISGRQILARLQPAMEDGAGPARQAEWFCRWLAELFSWRHLPETFQIFRDMRAALETDLSPAAGIWLGWEMSQTVKRSCAVQRLPGQRIHRQGRAYWQPEVAAALAFLSGDAGHSGRETVPVRAPVPPTPEPTAGVAGSGEAGADASRPQVEAPAVNIEPVKVPTRPRAPEVRVRVTWPGTSQPTVRVLNGCGTSGLGKRVSEKLMAYGLRIQAADIGNAPTFEVRRSFVRTAPKNLSWALGIAKILALDKRVQVLPDADPDLAVTIMIGSDHTEWLR